MEWLMEEASRLEKRVAELEQENRRLQETIQVQERELKKLLGEFNSLRREFMGDENPLSGRKVAIIGPSFRKEVYKELVEGLGGRFLFAPSEEKLSAIDRAMSKADGVIFITTYTSHKANDHVKAAEERYQVPVVPVNVTGLDALRDAILNMLNPIMEHRETASARSLMGRRFPAKCIDKLFEPIGHFFEVLHRIGKDFEPFPRPKGAGKCHTLRNSPGIWPVFGFRLSGSHPKKYKNSKLYALDPISLSEILWNSKKQPIRAGKITVLGPYFGDKAKNKAPPGRATAAGGAPKTI